MSALRFVSLAVVVIALPATAHAQARHRTGRPVANPRVIAQLEELLANTAPTDSDMPDILFRLADAHAQSAEYWRYKSDDAKADAALREAIATYKRLVDDRAFRRFARMDEALYFCAMTLQSARKYKDARQIFQRLIAKHPHHARARRSPL